MIESELYRLRGEMRLPGSSDDPAAWSLAEADFRKALEIARRQEARSLELRAAASLTRLQGRSGRRADGAHHLAATLASFTEGLQMPDLLVARELLDS